MLGILLLAEPCKACRVSAEPDPSTTVLSFPLDVYSFLNEAKCENGSRVVSNSNKCTSEKPIESVPVYWAQCTLPSHPIYEGLVPRLTRDGEGTS